MLAEIEAADTSELGLSQEAVSLALTVPVRTAQARLKNAGLLVRELPATLALLWSGQISYRHAEVICEQAWSVPAGLITPFEALAVARAADQTVSQLRQAARRAVTRIDPGGAERRHQQALTGRKVGLQPAEDGMVLLPVLLDAPQGQLIFTRLTAAATLLPATDCRTMDQKRADLLVDAVLSGLPHDALPELQGRRPSIQIVVSADTLLGLDDESADLAGYGPITAETARRYAADQSGTWRRLLTDPDTGALLDIGRDTYRPAQRLRDFVQARDGVCCFPTCGQPGYRCEFAAHRRVLRRRADLPVRRCAGLPAAQPVQVRYRMAVPPAARRLLPVDRRHRSPLHRSSAGALESTASNCCCRGSRRWTDQASGVDAGGVPMNGVAAGRATENPIPRHRQQAGRLASVADVQPPDP
ncbi:DUF222 domain-containing protein [Jatrophihabitans sp.]|uniref:DUF222 domain-containing protein n=1 Tax=Jatrophihabitans sp. TaxID=1932789 RepID=UPI002BBCEC5E|nr:DUF222 domain-containing protein [Jatrophihabitans sp.]